MLAEPGDEVVVAPGMYTENIDLLGKPIEQFAGHSRKPVHECAVWNDPTAMPSVTRVGKGSFVLIVSSGSAFP